MRAFAQLNNDGVCVALVQIEGPSDGLLPGPQLVPVDSYDGALLGRTWSDGIWGPPPSAERHITQLALGRRFTTPERVALELAALDNPAGTTQQRQQAAALRVYLADVAAARYIDLDRADTRAGVQALEADGLLASGRAAQILDAPVQAAERA